MQENVRYMHDMILNDVTLVRFVGNVGVYEACHLLSLEQVDRLEAG